MGDRMRCIPFRGLLERMFEEYRSSSSIFGIPGDRFYRKGDDRTIQLFGSAIETPLGPAAGPHTQLAQNIVTAYLTGSRFIELKTVQKLDSLDIKKPCIDMSDEGFNTEWSTELSLDEAYDEYLKAWFLLHLLEGLFEMKASGGERSFVFNMSVGYDLAGIKEERMDRYITRMTDSAGEELFTRYKGEMADALNDPALFAGTDLEGRTQELLDLPGRISSKICRSVTLSTMHGCPPSEIEAICSYMLEEKGLHTFVKLNPTLLGYDAVRGMLDSLGFGYVQLRRETFEKDLQYSDAVAMLERLAELASGKGLGFGVKLTNTLASVNHAGILPGEEMYMSGRALFPLSISLAARLSREFGGELPISYSGGISAHNVREVFETGIRPITVASEMLKPGGYLRMTQLAEELQRSKAWEMGAIDVEAIQGLAERALSEDYLTKDFRGWDRVGVPDQLPLFDCYVAPCVQACPINQDVPEYVRLVGEGRYSEALGLIYERNALPSITGHICDHQCQQSCTRLDYEGAVQIREMKRIAVENGFEDFREGWKAPDANRGGRVAVIGAGPAGLASAYFLAREGFQVEVFDDHDSAGGLVAHVIPRFRIPEEAVLHDIRFVEEHGVQFHFGADPEFNIAELCGQGFKYVVLAIGTYKSRALELDGGEGRVMSSLDFLSRYHRGEAMDLGKVVGVVGAGDTAMDAARAALRVDGVERSMIIYRRSREQMPASREEYEGAVEDGVEFIWLSNPECFEDDGLACREMELGEKDASGRARPVPTDRISNIDVDTLITSIGDSVDAELLGRAGIDLDEKGRPVVNEDLETCVEGVFLVGDADTGPSTIVRCISEARHAADAICRGEDTAWKRQLHMPSFDDQARRKALGYKKGRILARAEPAGADNARFAQREAARCLECNFVCNKCVEVCPNRANIAIPVGLEDGFEDSFQIVHLDAYCNECGNCATFCPRDGRPYRDKPTVFSSRSDFEGSENPGFLVEDQTLTVRWIGAAISLPLDEGGRGLSSSADMDGAEHMLRLFKILYSTRPALFSGPGGD